MTGHPHQPARSELARSEEVLERELDNSTVSRACKLPERSVANGVIGIIEVRVIEEIEEL